ncbi:MAG: SPOR domain-containing protein [Chromatiales bacterium]|jgi:DamX protein|nr:SPOR domain-containing protein [Chromatiales bacterium]MDX9767407.1 SPOR domain-containing protein [Ectothiorhodospiraceae bacterium]
MSETPENHLPSKACLDRLGLRQQPFDQLFSKAYLYTDPALEMPANVILENLRGDSPVMVLKGEDGAGKSTHLMRLIPRTGQMGIDCCAFRAKPRIGIDAVDYTVRQYWRAESELADDPNEPLHAVLCDLIGKGRQPVIVIDDAHLIPPETLLQLVELREEVREDCGGKLGIVLAGESEIERNFSAIEHESRDASSRLSVQARPFTREQTEAYLRHRLQAAGLTAPAWLNAELVARIHQESGGLPAAVNRAANRWLMQQQDEPAKSPRQPAPALTKPGQEGLHAEPEEAPVKAGGHAPGAAQKKWLIPGVVIVMLIGVIYTVFSVLRGVDKDSEILTIPLPVQPEPTEIVARPDDQAQASTEAIQPDPPPEHIPAPADIGVAEPAATPVAEPPAEAPAEPQTPSSQLAAMAPPPLPEVREAPVEPPAPKPDVQAPEQAKPQPKPAAPAPQPKPVAPVPTPAPEAAKPVPAQTAAALKSREWLMAQNPGWYTVQVIGLGSEQAVVDYADKHRLGLNTAWFVTRRDGRDWYVLVTGAHATPDAARDAISRLPAEVRANRPWIRTFGSVQDALRNNPAR